MTRAIFGTVTLHASYYVPFSTLVLKPGDKLTGYYDGAAIVVQHAGYATAYPLFGVDYTFEARTDIVISESL